MSQNACLENEKWISIFRKMQVLKLTVEDEFVNSLSFQGYFMAGNCVTNVIEGKEISGDVDLWVTEFDDFLPSFDEIVGTREFSVDIYPSCLMIYMDGLKPINLIYSGEPADKTVSEFDFDYCRAFYTPTLSKARPECLECIKTKVIRFPRRHTTNRVEKALRYGYTFLGDYQCIPSHPCPIAENVTDRNVVERAIRTLIVHNPVCDARYNELIIGNTKPKFEVHVHEFIVNFDRLFSLHPQQRHKIIMFGKEIQVYRWQSVYLNTPRYTTDLINKTSYMYSGFDLEPAEPLCNREYPLKYSYTSSQGEKYPEPIIDARSDPVEISYTDLPSEFDRFLEFARTVDERFNQVIVNWYQDGSDYIAQHRDCPYGLVEDSPIMIINLCEDSDFERVFKVENEYIPLENGTCIILKGNYLHGVPKNLKSKSRRISISFRCVKTEII